MKLRQSAGLFFIVALLAMILYMVAYTAEGFTAGQQCGVGLPSCQGERVRCINGYCRLDIAPKLPFFSDLPLAH